MQKYYTIQVHTKITLSTLVTVNEGIYQCLKANIDSVHSSNDEKLKGRQKGTAVVVLNLDLSAIPNVRILFPVAARMEVNQTERNVPKGN